MRAFYPPLPAKPCKGIERSKQSQGWKQSQELDKNSKGHPTESHPVCYSCHSRLTSPLVASPLAGPETCIFWQILLGKAQCVVRPLAIANNLISCIVCSQTPWHLRSKATACRGKKAAMQPPGLCCCQGAQSPIASTSLQGL